MVEEDNQPALPGRELSIVIPAYNEAERLPRFLATVLSFVEASGRPIEVLVVDDGSTDGTAEVALACRTSYPDLRVLRLPRNRGKGAAVRAGMIQARGTRRLFVDADGATAIDELPGLERALDAGAQLAIGSREAGDTRIVSSALRRSLGRMFNRAVRSRAIVGLRDTQCGFKLFHGDALRLFPQLQEDGFAFDVELLLLAQRRGLRIAEVPVNWTEVPGSKVHLLRDGVRMLRAVRRIEARFRSGKYDKIAPVPTPYLEADRSNPLMEPAEYGAMAAVEERHWWFRGRLALVRAFLRRAARPGVGLDVSSGTGMTLAHLAPWVQVGADISPLALEFCRARGLAKLTRGDLTRLPFADASFETLTCLDTLEHVQDDRAALAEIRRVLRPGGVAVITVPAHPWMFSGHDTALHHVRRYRRTELIERVRASGLELTTLRHSNVAVFPLVAVVRLLSRGSTDAQSDTSRVPATPLNAFLYALTALESFVLPYVPSPFGVSLICVVRRPSV